MSNVVDFNKTAANVPNYQAPTRAQLIEAMAAITSCATEEDAVSITSIIKGCRSIEKNMEDERTKITKPINTGLRQINAKFKETVAPLVDERTRLNVLLTGYLKEKAEQEREEREEAALAAAAEAEEYGEDEAAEEILEEGVANEKTQIRTMTGAQTSIRETWAFEVITKASVPEHFKIVDDRLIRQAIKDGQREIPGVRIYKKEQAVVR